MKNNVTCTNTLIFHFYSSRPHERKIFMDGRIRKTLLTEFTEEGGVIRQDTLVDTITDEIPQLPKDELVEEQKVETRIERQEEADSTRGSTPHPKTPQEGATSPEPLLSKIKFEDFLNLMEVF